MESYFFNDENLGMSEKQDAGGKGATECKR